MSDYVLLTDEAREQIQKNIDGVKATGDAVGGWTTKCDNRQTGFSYHAKFEKKVDVMTTMRFVSQMENALQMFISLAESLLAADQTVKDLQAIKVALLDAGLKS